MTAHDWRFFVAPIMIMLFVVLSVAPIQQASAQAATVITVTGAQVPVNIGAPFSPNEWSDTQMITIPTATMTVAFKYNATGLLFLMQWNNGTVDCHKQSCFGGIELGFLNNTLAMGSPLSPTIMVLLSPSFKGGYDEFVSHGESTPSTVESLGYKTQSTCSLALSGTTYTGQCYRPFKLNNASPYDPSPSLVPGSSIEIGFAVGDFASPGVHAATTMSSYVLVLGPAATTSTSTTTTPTTSGTISTSQTSSTTSTSQTSSTTSTTQTSSTHTQSPPAGPNVSYYWSELAVVVIGFSIFLLIVILRYQRS